MDYLCEHFEEEPTQSEIAAALAKSVSVINEQLQSLARDGKVTKEGRKYLPTPTSIAAYYKSGKVEVPPTYYVGDCPVHNGMQIVTTNGAHFRFNSDRMIIDGGHILDYVKRGYIAHGEIAEPEEIQGRHLYEKIP